jgi:hypothetical protein
MLAPWLSYLISPPSLPHLEVSLKPWLVAYELMALGSQQPSPCRSSDTLTFHPDASLWCYSPRHHSPPSLVCLDVCASPSVSLFRSMQVPSYDKSRQHTASLT